MCSKCIKASSRVVREKKKPPGLLGLCKINLIAFSFFSLTFFFLLRPSLQSNRSSLALMHLRQVGGRVFPLEAVKQLVEMMDLDVGVSPHLSETSTVAVCANPLLPQVFRPVCHAKGAGLVLSELGKDAQMSKSFKERHKLLWWKNPSFHL